MDNKKRLFLLLAILFFGAMAYISYDISSRTTFPGSKPQLQERIFNSDKKEIQDTVTVEPKKGDR